MVERTRRSRVNSQLILGLLVVIVGLLLLGETTDLYDTDFVLAYVPSLFILLGVYALVRSGFRNVFGPVVIIVAAAAWQLVTLEVVAWADLVQFWPLVLVLFGLSVIVGQWRSRPTVADQSDVSGLAVFGGSQQRSTASAFTGATLTALFGGAELDLREATVADPPAHVSAVALFGGVTIVVPRGWNVELDVLPILGGVSDDRPRRDADHETLDLVVSGFVAFGGITIED